MNRWGALGFLFFLVGLADEAHGKGGNIYRNAGDLLREPSGLKDVVIERAEELTFDLRPLDKGNKVRVEAAYHLNNTREEQKLKLVAYSQSGGGVEVLLDDKAQEGKAVNDPPPKPAPPPAPEPPQQPPQPAPQPPPQPPPQTARPNYTTPGLMGPPLAFNAFPRSTPRAFEITLPPGKHHLVLRYKSAQAAYRDTEHLKNWQVVYLLSPRNGPGGAEPARAQRLDITVHLPAGWEQASLPALERKGDTLRGSFDKVPSEVIALTVQAPLPANYAPTKQFNWYLMQGALWGGGLVCFLVGGAFGWWMRRLGRTTWWVLLAGLGTGTVWTGALLGAVHRMLTAHNELLPSAQRSPGVGQFFVLLFAWVCCLLALPGGIVLTQLGAVLARLVVKAPPRGANKEMSDYDPRED